MVFVLKANRKLDEKYLEGFGFKVAHTSSGLCLTTKRTCNHYDPIERLCTRYFDRPETCKNYPGAKDHPFFELMDSDGVKCGYDTR